MLRIVLALSLTTAVATPASAAPMTAHPVALSQPNAMTGCHLSYRGGPLIQHVKVFDVFYSPGYQFKSMLEGYYAAVTSSAHFDMLSEYNVANYKISRGTFIGSYEDSNPNPATVTPLQDPGAYLRGLITAHKVPAPDDDTLYMMYFPSGIDPYLQGTASCITARTFCAYHNSFTIGNQLVRYGVMPDVTAGMCAGGCGPMDRFQSLCEVSSHELVEAVTDPDANGSWVDTMTQGCGEIGDICAGPGANGTIAGYTVQKEWSNMLNACVVSNPNIMVNDFSVAAAPATVIVPQGGMATATLTLTKVSGMAENVALTTMTAPTGITASFMPASTTSDNGTSTITLLASPTATLGMAKVTVKAAGASVTKSQDVNIDVVPPPDMAMSPDLAQPSGGGSDGGGTGGNGNNRPTGCSCTMGSAAGPAGGWAAAALLFGALAMRRRRRP